MAEIEIADNFIKIENYLTGSINPLSSIGIDGDAYINLADQTLFFKSSGSWLLVSGGGGNMMPGVIADSIDPGRDIGQDGQFYVNTVTHSLFYKNNGVWILLCATSSSGGSGPGGSARLYQFEQLFPDGSFEIIEVDSSGEEITSNELRKIILADASPPPTYQAVVSANDNGFYFKTWQDFTINGTQTVGNDIHIQFGGGLVLIVNGVRDIRVTRFFQIDQNDGNGFGEPIEAGQLYKKINADSEETIVLSEFDTHRRPSNPVMFQDGFIHRSWFKFEVFNQRTTLINGETPAGGTVTFRFVHASAHFAIPNKLIDFEAGSFTDITDTPANYDNSGGDLLRVKDDESSIEFVNDPNPGQDTRLKALESEVSDLSQLLHPSSTEKIQPTISDNIATYMFTPEIIGVYRVTFSLSYILESFSGIIPEFVDFTVSISGGGVSFSHTFRKALGDQEVAILNFSRNFEFTIVEEVTVTVSASVVGNPTAMLTLASVNPLQATHEIDLDFISLRDTPSTYSGNAGKILRVNANGDGIEFVDASSL